MNKRRNPRRRSKGACLADRRAGLPPHRDALHPPSPPEVSAFHPGSAATLAAPFAFSSRSRYNADLFSSSRPRSVRLPVRPSPDVPPSCPPLTASAPTFAVPSASRSWPRCHAATPRFSSARICLDQSRCARGGIPPTQRYHSCRLPCSPFIPPFASRCLSLAFSKARAPVALARPAPPLRAAARRALLAGHPCDPRSQRHRRISSCPHATLSPASASFCSRLHREARGASARLFLSLLPPPLLRVFSQSSSIVAPGEFYDAFYIFGACSIFSRICAPFHPFSSLPLLFFILTDTHSFHCCHRRFVCRRSLPLCASLLTSSLRCLVQSSRSRQCARRLRLSTCCIDFIYAKAKPHPFSAACVELLTCTGCKSWARKDALPINNPCPPTVSCPHQLPATRLAFRHLGPGLTWRSACRSFPAEFDLVCSSVDFPRRVCTRLSLPCICRCPKEAPPMLRHYERSRPER